MRKILISAIFVLFGSVFAQESTNRFEDSEVTADTHDNEAYSPGDPDGDDDVPIGDYVPALAIVGVGLIAYYMRNRKLTEGS